jgi:hypothetical protein
MVRSAIERHSTSLKMLFEVSMLVQLIVVRRISRRCASRPGKNFFSFGSTGVLQDTDTNTEPVSCGASSQCQVAALTESREGRGSKCSAVERVVSSKPL